MTLPKMDLTSKVAVVTGGNRGLDWGMALALAKAGADVAVASRTVTYPSFSRIKIKPAK